MNDRAVEEATKAVADMEKELSSLGFFAIGKKNELKKTIESGKINIQNLKAKKESLLKEYDDKAAAANRKAASDSDDVRYVIEMHYPIPESPKEKERKRKEAEEEKRRQEEELKAQKELISKFNDREKELYKELCGCYGENFYVTPSILAGFTFGGSNRSNPKAYIASAFLHKLEDAGMLNKEIRDGTTKYILKQVI